MQKVLVFLLLFLSVALFSAAHAIEPVKGEGYDVANEGKESSASDGVVWGDVLEEIADEEDISYFKNALILAGIDKEISKGSFSVFAPQNEVFEEMDKDILAKLEAIENRKKLKRLIRMHIVPGSIHLVPSRSKTTRMETLSSQDFIIAKRFGRDFFINNKKIVSTDMHADGILYEMDGLVVDVDQWEFKEPDPKKNPAKSHIIQ